MFSCYLLACFSFQLLIFQVFVSLLWHKSFLFLSQDCQCCRRCHPPPPPHYCSSFQSLGTQYQTLLIWDICTFYVPVELQGPQTLNPTTWQTCRSQLTVKSNSKPTLQKEENIYLYRYKIFSMPSLQRKSGEGAWVINPPLFLLRALSFLLSLSIAPSSLTLTPGLPFALAHLLAHLPSHQPFHLSPP